MNQSNESIAVIYREHAATLSKLQQQTKNPVIAKAIEKVNLIASELEKNHIITSVPITEQVARAIWVKIDVGTEAANRTNALVMQHLVDEFLLLNAFVGPIPDPEGIIRRFEFHTDLTGDAPFKFRYSIVEENIEEYRYYEIKLTREAYISNNMNRDLSSALCAIQIDLIPPIVNENAEIERVMVILKRLNTNLRKTFCYLKRDHTPTNSSLTDALDVVEEDVGE